MVSTLENTSVTLRAFCDKLDLAGGSDIVGGLHGFICPPMVLITFLSEGRLQVSRKGNSSKWITIFARV
jgi:hypothetical protein